jgi:hypothetical protein
LIIVRKARRVAVAWKTSPRTGAPDPRQQVPPVARADADVDQRDAVDPLPVRGRPAEADRAAEVVQDEVDALHPECRERRLDEFRVAEDGVLEPGRRDGLAEVRQVEGERADPGRADGAGQRLPVVAGARVAVDEDDRGRRLRRTGFDQARGGPGDVEAAAAHSGRRRLGCHQAAFSVPTPTGTAAPRPRPSL